MDAEPLACVRLVAASLFRQSRTTQNSNGATVLRAPEKKSRQRPLHDLSHGSRLFSC